MSGKDHGHQFFFGIDTDLELRHFKGRDVEKVLQVDIPDAELEGMKDPYRFEVLFKDNSTMRLEDLMCVEDVLGDVNGDFVDETVERHPFTKPEDN